MVSKNCISYCFNFNQKELNCIQVYLFKFLLSFERFVPDMLRSSYCLFIMSVISFENLA